MGHQTELHEKLQEGDLAKGGSIPSGKKGKRWKKFQSYNGEGCPLDEVEAHRVRPAYCCSLQPMPIILTDLSRLKTVPLHTSTITDAGKNDEGEYTYLRITFQIPGMLGR